MIERGEYNKLFDFVKHKNIPIKNVDEEAQSDSDSDLRDSDASDTETRYVCHLFVFLIRNLEVGGSKLSGPRFFDNIKKCS